MLNIGRALRMVRLGVGKVSTGLLLTVAIGLINYGLKLLEEGRHEGLILVVCGVIVIAFTLMLFEAGIIERVRVRGGVHGE